jgi:hypothetical protein
VSFLRRIGAAAMAMLLLYSPVLACVDAYGQLAPAEEECCRRMGPDCGGMKAAEHSCCAKPSRPEPTADVASAFRSASPLVALALPVSATQDEPVVVAHFASTAAQEHPPPLIGAAAVLRI